MFSRCPHCGRRRPHDRRVCEIFQVLKELPGPLRATRIAGAMEAAVGAALEYLRHPPPAEILELDRLEQVPKE